MVEIYNETLHDLLSDTGKKQAAFLSAQMGADQTFQTLLGNVTHMYNGTSSTGNCRVNCRGLSSLRKSAPSFPSRCSRLSGPAGAGEESPHAEHDGDVF